MAAASAVASPNTARWPNVFHGSATSAPVAVTAAISASTAGPRNALWLVATLITLCVTAPALRAAAAEVADGRPAQRFAARLGVAGGLSALCWVAIVVLMVYKPGQ